MLILIFLTLDEKIAMYVRIERIGQELRSPPYVSNHGSRNQDSANNLNEGRSRIKSHMSISMNTHSS